MDQQLKRDIKRYIKEINQNIICDFRTRKKFISDIKNSVYDFAESENAVTMDDICKHFGTPQQIAKEFLLNADVKQIKRRMNVTKIVLIGIIAALVMWAAGLVYAIIDANVIHSGDVIEEIGDVDDDLILKALEENI
ncbi:MAG: hypothetical protein K2I14_04990 [Eubacterium sp.]|nr:hypothetical protein [Eubacterium sp.]